MTDYDITIRSLDPTYNYTLPRDAGRDITEGRELHLARFTVEVKVVSGTGDDRVRRTYGVRFDVNHDDDTVTLGDVGDAFNERDSFDAERLLTAIEYAQRAAIAYIEDVGPNYHLRTADDLLAVAAEGVNDCTVHTTLEVGADA